MESLVGLNKAVRTQSAYIQKYKAECNSSKSQRRKESYVQYNR